MLLRSSSSSIKEENNRDDFFQRVRESATKSTTLSKALCNYCEFHMILMVIPLQNSTSQGTRKYIKIGTKKWPSFSRESLSKDNTQKRHYRAFYCLIKTFSRHGSVIIRSNYHVHIADRLVHYAINPT